jgi:hypothetical protein
MGNFSRNTFTVLKAPDANGFYRDYRGVRLQMGVPLVDADWNELEDARKAELRDLSAAVIGTGVPLGGNGFAIAVLSPSPGAVPQFTIEAGAMVANGVLVTNKAKINYTQQEYYAGTQAGQQRASARGVTPVPVLTALPTYGGNPVTRTDQIYLEVWEREVNSQEDPRIMDNALLEETCVRLRLEWAVRVAQNGAAVPASDATYTRVPLATVQYSITGASQATATVTDLRRKGLSLAALVDQPRSISVVPAGFPLVSSYYTNWDFDGYRAIASPPPIGSNTTAYHSMVVPVTLPNGANLRGLRIIGKKTGGNLWVYFVASSMQAAGTWTYLMPNQIWNSGQSVDPLDMTVATYSHVVDPTQYKYFLVVYGWATRLNDTTADNVQISGFEVQYQL